MENTPLPARQPGRGRRYIWLSMRTSHPSAPGIMPADGNGADLFARSLFHWRLVWHMLRWVERRHCPPVIRGGFMKVRLTVPVATRPAPIRAQGTPPTPARPGVTPAALLRAGRTAAAAALLAVAVAACGGGGSPTSVPSVSTPSLHVTGTTASGGASRTPSPSSGGTGKSSATEKPTSSTTATSTGTATPTATATSTATAAPTRRPTATASATGKATPRPTPTVTHHATTTPT